MAWIAAIISAVGGGLAGAGQQSSSNKAMKKASAAQTKYYEEAKGRAQPYSLAGRQGLSGLMELMGMEGYRTPEERAYTEYMQTKPTYGKADWKDFADSSTKAIARHPGYKEGGSGYAGSVYMSGLGGLADMAFRSAKSGKKKAALAAAADQKKKEAKLAEWQKEADRLKAASDASLANYDRDAAIRAILEATPGYAFRYGQGLDAVQSGQAARLNQLSGRAQKELTQYGQDMGTQEYQNEWNRRASLAGIGQSADAMLANMAVGQGSNQANLALMRGAAGVDAYSTFNNALQSGLSNYMTIKARNENTRASTPTSTGSVYGSSYGGGGYNSDLYDSFDAWK